VPREIAQIGRHGVDMHSEQRGHGRSGETGGMEQEHFRTAMLPGLEGLLQPSMDAVEFGGTRFPSIQGTRQG
jgi:hypothetical protein